MITKEVLAPIAYIKKSPITGSYEGMRFRLSKIVDGEETKLECVFWPEPYNFLKTSEDLKKYQIFDFSEEGIDSSVAWLNAEWESHQDEYKKLAKWSSEWV